MECLINAEPSDLVVGLMMISFGFAGLFRAAGAHDSGIYVFGLALAGFAWMFVMRLIRRHYDRLELAPIHARVSHNV
jgi:hypothetical protein